MMSALAILGQSYEIIDAIENITVADSFVMGNEMGGGHGEARLYVGPQNAERNFTSFFDNFSGKCFFVKKDLYEYLNNAKFEYENQEQAYKRDISPNWQKHINELSSIKDEIIYFYISSAIGTHDRNRYYIRSKDYIYKFIRKISLPQITYITILKLKSQDGQNIFYFRLFLDYYYDPSHHPAKIRKIEKKIQQDKKIPATEKRQIIKARDGQGLFREKLTNHIPVECPITRVNDERLLEAAHIKPWGDSSDTERLDYFNGIFFTPTYHKLFDQGFITFEEDGAVLISPYISPLNVKRLNLIPNKKYPVPTKGREEYLKYHREEIFKK